MLYRNGRVMNRRKIRRVQSTRTRSLISGLDWHDDAGSMSCNSELLSEGRMAPLFLVSNTNRTVHFSRLEIGFNTSFKCMKKLRFLSFFFFKLLTIEVIHDIRPTSHFPHRTIEHTLFLELLFVSFLFLFFTIKYLELYNVYSASPSASRSHLPAIALLIYFFTLSFDLSSTKLRYDYAFRHICITIRIIRLTHTTFRFKTKYLNITRSTQSITNVKTMVM